MQVQSKFDPDTHYIVTSKHVRICRNGDKLTMPYGQIPEQAKRFRPEIQEELMAFWTKKHPLIECACCGKLFHEVKGAKFCSPECQQEVQRARAKHQTQKCVWCGKNFSGYNGTLYCSSVCKKEARKSRVHEDTRETKESHLQRKLQLAESKGMTYAEMQKQETLKLVGKVVI